MSNSFNPNKLRSRLLKSLGANAYGQIISTGIQLLSIPLFLHYWGAAKYGEWLILSAIPAYLSLSDIGFASVSANEMTMLQAKNDREGTLRVYQSGWALLSCMSVLVILIFVPTILLFEPSAILHLSLIPSQDVVLILLCLAAQVLLSLQGGMISAGFRSSGNNALGVMYGNSIRLFEWLSAALILVLQFGPLAIAVAFLVCRLTGTTLSLLALKKITPWLEAGFAHSSKTTISTLLKPAVAFMAFPLGLALSLQGAVIVIGSLLGPLSVTIFSTYRTLSRLLVQAITMINQAIWPEMSAAYGAGNYLLVKKLHRRGFAITFWLGLVGMLMVGLFGDWFVGVWTQHKLPSQPVLLWILLVAAYLNILWQSSWVLLMATNKHHKISILFVTSALFSLGLIALTTDYLGIKSAALIIAIAEVPLLLFAINAGLVMTNDNIRAFLLAPFRLTTHNGIN